MTINTQKKILIVEDEAPVRKLYSQRLAMEGFDISEAADGEGGLKLALKEHPDLILLDLVMPKMDGIAMLRELRKDNWGKTSLVITITNSQTPQLQKDAWALGVADFIIKNEWKVKDLVKKVKETLGVF